jgi:thymidylate synthase (FAD)
MHKIEVGLLNFRPDENRLLMNLAASISQHGHKVTKITDLGDPKFTSLPSDKKVRRLVNLPHPTLQKFKSIEILFIGVSRRFLAQITRHQNEIKFMSSSFQYGDHSSDADFVTPIEVSRAPHDVYELYEKAMLEDFEDYNELVCQIGRDAAGYLMPQATRCTIMASATAYEWKHIIRQRTCKRNTPEMRYVMLNAWANLYSLDPEFFSPETTGPMCIGEGCNEGKMSCKGPYIGSKCTPTDILEEEFSDILPKKKEEE